MRKLIFGLAVCAGLFWACSNDDVVTTGGGTDNMLSGDVAYLTVRIKDVNSSSTRGSDGGYSYGTSDEQYVANAYFYFYDDNGNYMARGNVGETSGTASTGTAGNIEWESNTMVAVYGLELDEEGKLPTRMITVLNQPAGFNGTNKSLNEMVAALAGVPYADANGNFVMSTSVYTSGGSIVNYTTLEEDDFSLEPINLEEHYTDNGNSTAVDVYVERLAAKVAVSASSDLSADYIDITSFVAEEFANGAPEGGVYVKLLGFDVDAVARDAYMLKNIADNSNWGTFTFAWNGADSYRSYWAESPNYGDGTHTYPTSSLGNTDDDEFGTGEQSPLDSYLKYTSLASPVEFGDATYCGENTNTAGTSGVITATDNTGLTNILVKAQVYTLDEDEEYVPLSLVEYHGMYYTADEFLQKCVDDVVNYDFTVLVDEVIAALQEEYSTFAGYIEDLKTAIIPDNVYTSEAVQGHIHTNGTPSSVTAFGGEMLSLYNDYDGNVRIFYNMSTQPQWGTTGSFTNIDETLYDKYPASKIVYGGADLDEYEFWFHVDSSQLGALERLGLEGFGLLVEIDGEYYMPIDNSVSFTTSSSFDSNFTGNHTYTTRNFLLRAITVEADGIDGEFGSHFPNLFADGLMYYHTPIEHLGSISSTSTEESIVEGQYGVVRNHYYNITVTYLENFGRGIADDNEVIVPQPEVTYYYLGTDVNILSWKMVTSEVGW